MNWALAESAHISARHSNTQALRMERHANGALGRAVMYECGGGDRRALWEPICGFAEISV
jgi:hypothetical protein